MTKQILLNQVVLLSLYTEIDESCYAPQSTALAKQFNESVNCLITKHGMPKSMIVATITGTKMFTIPCIQFVWLPRHANETPRDYMRRQLNHNNIRCDIELPAYNPIDVDDPVNRVINARLIACMLGAETAALLMYMLG